MARQRRGHSSSCEKISDFQRERAQRDLEQAAEKAEPTLTVIWEPPVQGRNQAEKQPMKLRSLRLYDETRSCHSSPSVSMLNATDVARILVERIAEAVGVLARRVDQIAQRWTTSRVRSQLVADIEAFEAGLRNGFAGGPAEAEVDEIVGSSSFDPDDAGFVLKLKNGGQMFSKEEIDRVFLPKALLKNTGASAETNNSTGGGQGQQNEYPDHDAALSFIIQQTPLIATWKDRLLRVQQQFRATYDELGIVRDRVAVAYSDLSRLRGDGALPPTGAEDHQTLQEAESRKLIINPFFADLEHRSGQTLTRAVGILDTAYADFIEEVGVGFFYAEDECGGFVNSTSLARDRPVVVEVL